MIKFKKAIATLSVASALALGVTLGSATPFSPSTSKAEAVTYTKCYTAMNGERWCYQSNCNWWEYTFNGCRDGWVRSNVWSS